MCGLSIIADHWKDMPICPNTQITVCFFRSLSHFDWRHLICNYNTGNMSIPRSLTGNIWNFKVITMPADSLGPLFVRISANTIVTKFLPQTRQIPEYVNAKQLFAAMYHYVSLQECDLGNTWYDFSRTIDIVNFPFFTCVPLGYTEDVRHHN